LPKILEQFGAVIFLIVYIMIKNKIKQNQEIVISQLNGKKWIDKILSLHLQIHDELPDEKKHSFLFREKEYFLSLLDEKQKDKALIAVIDNNDNLLGMCSVFLQNNWKEARKNNYITCEKDLSHIYCDDKKIAVLQSLCLVQSMKGKGIASKLICCAIKWSKDNLAFSVFSQVAHDNPCSWVQLMRQDFNIVESWSTNHGRYLLNYNCNKSKNKIIQTCITAKEEFYVGASAHDDWISLFESHLDTKGVISYHQPEKQSKLLRFDFEK